MEEKYLQLESRLNKIAWERLEKERVYYKYPRSVRFYRTPSVAYYQEVGISDPQIIGRLIDKEIIPFATIGSESQGKDRYETQFCLEGYVELGVTSPDDMLRLAELKVRPYQLKRLLKELIAVRADSELVDIVCGGLTGSTLGEDDNQLVTMYRERKSGKQMQEWVKRSTRE